MLDSDEDKGDPAWCPRCNEYMAIEELQAHMEEEQWDDKVPHHSAKVDGQAEHYEQIQPLDLTNEEDYVHPPYRFVDPSPQPEVHIPAEDLEDRNQRFEDVLAQIMAIIDPAQEAEKNPTMEKVSNHPRPTLNNPLVYC
jgi:hypothetical protein